MEPKCAKCSLSRFVLLIFLVILIFSLLGCSSSSDELKTQINVLKGEKELFNEAIKEKDEEISDLENQISELSKELAKQKNSNTLLENEIKSLKERLELFESEQMVSEGDIVLEVTDKREVEINLNLGIFSPRVEFDFKVINNTEKDVKGVQGTFHIYDMFGVLIKSNRLDFTDKVIPSKSSIVVTDLGSDINQFMNNDVKLFQTAYENLMFEYEVSSIIFTDGTKKIDD